MINDTTNMSEEERKSMEYRISDETNKVRFTCPERKMIHDNIIENENEEPSPFKIYEETHCNKCADYRGCLGLIDSMSMNLQDNKKSGSEALDNMVKSFGSMTFTMRFKLVLDCMHMREYLNKVQ